MEENTAHKQASEIDGRPRAAMKATPQQARRFHGPLQIGLTTYLGIGDERNLAEEKAPSISWAVCPLSPAWGASLFMFVSPWLLEFPLRASGQARPGRRHADPKAAGSILLGRSQIGETQR